MARGTDHSETYVYTAGFSAAALCAFAGTAVSKNPATHANGHASARPTRVRILFLQDLRATARIWPNFVFEKVEGEPIADRRYAGVSRVSSCYGKILDSPQTP